MAKTLSYEQFERYLRHLQQQERTVSSKARGEYARDENNEFANFDRVGRALNLDRKKVLLVYASKHWDGILSDLCDGTGQREDVTGRIQDLRLYLALLWAMVTVERDM